MAFRRKGLQFTPNATLVNLRGTICGGSSRMSGLHRNLSASLSAGLIDNMRNAFSMSAARATG